MRTVPKFHTRNTDTVNAYQPSDFTPHLNSVIAVAKRRWTAEWEKQGSEDRGTSTIGKGIRIWFVGKGKRSAERLTIIKFDHSQGNCSAYAAVQPALDYLKEHGVEGATYFDGYMD